MGLHEERARHEVFGPTKLGAHDRGDKVVVLSHRLRFGWEWVRWVGHRRVWSVESNPLLGTCTDLLPFELGSAR